MKTKMRNIGSAVFNQTPVIIANSLVTLLWLNGTLPGWLPTILGTWLLALLWVTIRYQMDRFEAGAEMRGYERGVTDMRIKASQDLRAMIDRATDTTSR